uniref:Uncharacterized protein n=1 Tax=Arundo donax TaxID=35708 RepID=A0A0A9H0A6_ARUDO
MHAFHLYDVISCWLLPCRSILYFLYFPYFNLLLVSYLDNWVWHQTKQNKTISF